MATHEFKPTRYYNTIGSHPPVLRVAPGDTVITTCVDARGLDRSDAQATPPGNPMTGPFYVEGAQPGDTLIFKLEKLRPNRKRGWSAAWLANNVAEPNHVAEMARAGSQAGTRHDPWNWDVDAQAGAAKLNRPGSPLHGFGLELDPMLGCFGVAADEGQAISTATSGTHGGNMDYRGFREGVTVYFPVFAEGALFFLGDGHALQGDGEICGTGIEISMDVQFTLDLIKGQKIEWPRGENDEYIFTVGNARPLDQCVQHASSEMLRWLTTSYGLDTAHASLLMGQTVRYDLGNIFDPAYTMVCKMPKKLLAQAAR
ncbi:MAG: acetamidase [Meiothermus sp.]